MSVSDRPIMIKKVKRIEAGGHHGGAWKVAYADFVTAMMAFFLLLWLLNVTTDIQRRGIADYFAPASISKSESGAGGVFAGESITSTSGAQISQYTPPTDEEVTMPTAGKGEEGEEDTKGKDENPGNGKSKDQGNGTGVVGTDNKMQETKGANTSAPPPAAASSLSKEDQAMAEA